MTELGILDIRSITGALEKLHPFDFKNLALTSFKRRLEYIIEKYQFRGVDELIKKLQTDKDFLDDFLYDLTIKGTELFRDPSLWRTIKTQIFNDIKNSISTYKIWFCGNSTGEELYSFMILLNQAGLSDKVKIYVSCLSSKGIDNIKEKTIDNKQYELSLSNYERISTNKPLLEYFSDKANQRTLDTILGNNIEFIKENSIFENAPESINLVFLRNQMIYFNQILQEKFLGLIYRSLYTNGNLIIGVNESLENTSYSKNFIKDSSGENIFKKKSNIR